MKKINILDVTLREGGFRKGNDFGEKISCDVVTGLDQIGIDYIEFTLRLPEPIALNLNGCNSFLELIRKQASQAKLVVMCIPGLIKEHEFQEIKDCGMDMVRILFEHDKDSSEGLRLIKTAKLAGLEVSANFISALCWQEKQIKKIIPKMIDVGVDIIYIADSCGSMTPVDVKNYINIIKKYNPKHIGFHGHDNIGMALLNSITAINYGADFVDSSLRGIGNSSGNLKTEILLTYLNKIHGSNFDLIKLLELASNFEINVPEATPIHTPQQIVLGILDLHENQTHLEKIIKISQDESISWFAAAISLKIINKNIYLTRSLNVKNLFLKTSIFILIF